MFRIGMPSLASLSAVACLTLCGCMDEAAKQHGEAVKAIDAAAVRLGMLSPDLNAAAKEAQSVLNALRAIDVQSGPLASVRSALTAKAQLVLGEASLEAAVVSRREVATLGGRIEARLQSLQRLQSFADHARFTPTQLGFDALEQSMGPSQRSTANARNADRRLAAANRPPADPTRHRCPAYCPGPADGPRTADCGIAHGRRNGDSRS